MQQVEAAVCSGPSCTLGERQPVQEAVRSPRAKLLEHVHCTDFRLALPHLALCRVLTLLFSSLLLLECAMLRLLQLGRIHRSGLCLPLPLLFALLPCLLLILFLLLALVPGSLCQSPRLLFRLDAEERVQSQEHLDQPFRCGGKRGVGEGSERRGLVLKLCLLGPRRVLVQLRLRILPEGDHSSAQVAFELYDRRPVLLPAAVAVSAGLDHW